MNTYLIYFLVSFIAALLWYRFLFVLAPKGFHKPWLRTLINLRWHHVHWGILDVFIGTVILLFFGENKWVFIFLGIGLGFITDLFIPSLMLGSNEEEVRRQELVVYRNSLIPTWILGACVIIAILILSIFLHTKY